MLVATEEWKAESKGHVTPRTNHSPSFAQFSPHLTSFFYSVNRHSQRLFHTTLTSINNHFSIVSLVR